MGRWILLALATVLGGCTVYEVGGRCPDVGGAAGRDATLVATSSTSGTEALDEDDAPNGPPPAHEPAKEGTFEIFARLVFKSIPYKDCGSGGSGDVDVTFAPAGSVEKVEVWADGWQDQTKQCVAERFAFAHVTPFAGGPRTVRWRVVLGDDSSHAW
jgi:hypothetical protein